MAKKKTSTTTTTTRPPVTAQGDFNLNAYATGQSEVGINDVLSSVFGISVVEGSKARVDFGPGPKGPVPFPTFQGGDVTSHINQLENLASQRRAIPAGIKTINDALSFLHALPEDAMNSWKNEMYAAGLYADGFYSKGLKPKANGVMDNDDLYAAKGLMGVATRAMGLGMTVQDVLAQLKTGFAGQGGAGGPGGGGRTVTFQTTDPATIGRYADAFAEDLLGRALTPEERSRVVTRVAQQERAQGRQVAKAQLSGTGDQIIENQNVDVAAQAEQQIKSEHQGEATAKNYADAMDVFVKMLRGG